MECGRLTRCADCTIKNSNSDFCPLASPPAWPCGYGEREATIRKLLPLQYDEATHTHRKFLGRQHDNTVP